MSDVELYTWFVYAMPLGIILIYLYLRQRRSRRNQRILNEAKQSGLGEPASLHPLIDPAICVGCGACVNACPEGKILGLINGKAQLISPSHCIGHGACKRACPMDAIELVFGTEKRGVDIPFVQESFETNVPGIYIAGELGGMGLIRNACEQGRQAMLNIAKQVSKRSSYDYDVVIVGAGPAGLAASLAAHEKKLKYLTLEQDSLGGTVFKFPRGKLVMTAPVKLPIVGKVSFRETTKESLLAFWQKVEKETGIKIRYREKMDAIDRLDNGFRVRTPKGEYTTQSVLLSIGRRGTPRKLNVAGEDQPKVVYSLIDASQYQGQHVLVVGGGDAALEAATSIAEEPNTTVTISYRSDSFSRAKEKNRQKIESASKAGRLHVVMSSNVQEIKKNSVLLEQGGKVSEINNDAVIICAGGILPTPFLKETGILVETKYGSA